ncbi:hypothetical protein BS78_05G203800 [Paspalum vaginatum]|nr:hypothetical protein BS78_05G203800 [Paspalum vaginatum]
MFCIHSASSRTQIQGERQRRVDGRRQRWAQALGRTRWQAAAANGMRSGGAAAGQQAPAPLRQQDAGQDAPPVTRAVLPRLRELQPQHPGYASSLALEAVQAHRQVLSGRGRQVRCREEGRARGEGATLGPWAGARSTSTTTARPPTRHSMRRRRPRSQQLAGCSSGELACSWSCARILPGGAHADYRGGWLCASWSQGGRRTCARTSREEGATIVQRFEGHVSKSTLPRVGCQRSPRQWMIFSPHFQRFLK